MAPLGFEPTISAGERPQTYVLVQLICLHKMRRSHWAHGLRRMSATARLLMSVRIPPGHGSLCVVNDVRCHVEVPATNCSLTQKTPTDFGASLCVVSKPQDSGHHGQRWTASPQEIIGIECFKRCINRKILT
jgi:hypothetical protein